MADQWTQEASMSVTTETGTSATTRIEAGRHGRRPAWVRFGLHLVEMVVAMMVGMMALGAAVDAALAAAGTPHLFDRVDVEALVMATNMTIGMSLWMWFRRHTWTAIVEMGAAMYLPFAVFLVPFWAGLVPGSLVMAAGHTLMVPAMVVAMLRRREEYLGHHGS
jgi:hypothetical protein